MSGPGGEPSGELGGEPGGGPVAGLMAELEAAFATSDLIFSLLPAEALLERPIALRHPFIFYLGHLPAFAWNQLGRGALGLGPMDAGLDVLFERGIDPAEVDMTEVDPVSQGPGSQARWPEAAEIAGYRDRVRAAVRALAPELAARGQAGGDGDDPLIEGGRVLALILAHELRHHETLLYLYQERPPGSLRPPPGFAPRGGDGRAAERIAIPAGEAVLGARWEDIPFGWDNEFGQERLPVPAFSIDSLPVRNRDWLDFWRRTEDPALWPAPWVRHGNGGGAIRVKTVGGPVPFDLAAGWPAQVTADQAAIYCAASGGRLPSEAEIRRARTATPDGAQGGISPEQAPAQAPAQAPVSAGFGRWSPEPVGSAPAAASPCGVEELTGNGWEWTGTPFRPLRGFRAWARTYPGYSADFFDGAHNVVCGASWATAPRLLRPSFRNWYRRSYPYVFSSFRVCREIA